VGFDRGRARALLFDGRDGGAGWLKSGNEERSVQTSIRTAFCFAHIAAVAFWGWQRSV